MLNYIALLRKDKDTDYGVDFPDFPGCITAGSSVDETIRLAREVLEFHIEGMVEDGEDIPSPADIEDILKDPENQEGLVMAFIVSVPSVERKARRINITFPQNVLDEVDLYVREQGEGSRSAFLAKAAKTFMAGKKSGKETGKKGGRKIISLK